MFTKALIIGPAIAVSAVSFSTFASAKLPMKPIFINCAILGTCPIIKPLPFPVPPAPAPSGPDFNLTVNLGGGGYGSDGISCGEGRAIVRHHGFKHVHTTDCSGDVYAYSAFKKGQFVEVDVDSNGGIIDVSAY